MSGFDGASTATACGVILISRGVIYCGCACYAAASIAHGYASGTAASCALEAHETCLACRANGFGCAFSCGSYKHTMWPAAKQSIFRAHRGSRKIGYASNLWRASL